MHCVFSTKERRKLITPELQERLYPYLGGIARENKIKALSIGGVEDHVHALLSIPSTLSIAKTVQLLKGTPQSGFTRRFLTSVCSSGRRDMEHLALPSQALKTQ
jgi:REP element-mobilizing transposase RayT